MRSIADHGRIAGEVAEQRRILPAAERNHELQIQPRARFGNQPEGPKDPVLQRFSAALSGGIVSKNGRRTSLNNSPS